MTASKIHPVLNQFEEKMRKVWLVQFLGTFRNYLDLWGKGYFNLCHLEPGSFCIELISEMESDTLDRKPFSLFQLSHFWAPGFEAILSTQSMIGLKC